MAKRAKTAHKVTRSGLKKLGAKRFAAATAGVPGPAANSPTHQKGSFIVAPGPGGTTIVCFFNPNTGNFDDCHTVQGTVGIIPA